MVGGVKDFATGCPAGAENGAGLSTPLTCMGTGRVDGVSSASCSSNREAEFLADADDDDPGFGISLPCFGGVLI